MQKVVAARRCTVLQDDVLTWVEKVLVDAPKQGAGQRLLQDPEDAPAGAAAPQFLVLRQMLMNMHEGMTSVCALLQDDVRMWVAKVLVDVLRQAVSQGLLTEPEEAQAGGAGAAMAPQFFMLGRMLMTMLHCAEQQPRATRTYIFRDSNQEIFQILQVPLADACCTPEDHCPLPC